MTRSAVLKLVTRTIVRDGRILITGISQDGEAVDVELPISASPSLFVALHTALSEPSADGLTGTIETSGYDTWRSSDPRLIVLQFRLPPKNARIGFLLPVDQLESLGLGLLESAAMARTGQPTSN